MGRHTTDDDTRIWQAMVVDAYSDTSWDEYLRQTSLADDNRNAIDD